MRNLYLSGGLFCLLLFTGIASGAETGIPAKYRPMVDRGLRWLVTQQDRKTGHWEANGHSFPVSMTALAGMAVLAEGSTPREGKYAKNIRLAGDYVLSKAQPNGLIGDPNVASESGRYMYSHAYGLLFLSTLYGEEEDRARRKKIEEVLVGAVKFSGEAQTTRGGWGYVSAKDGSDFDEGAVTIANLQGVRAARRAGIKVPAEIIKKAQKYLQDATGPDGGVRYSLAGGGCGGGRPAITAGAIACAFSPDEYNSELVKKWIQFCRRQIPVLGKARQGYDEYTHYYYAQAVYNLGDDGYGKLFPDSNKEDRLTWKRYREQTFDHLQSTQAKEGYWESGVIGPVFTTAVYLNVLQLDNAVPWWIQR
jgi:hypothetical protein